MKGSIRKELRIQCVAHGSWAINLNSRMLRSHFLSFSASCPALLLTLIPKVFPQSFGSPHPLAASLSSNAKRTTINKQPGRNWVNKTRTLRLSGKTFRKASVSFSCTHKAWLPPQFLHHRRRQLQIAIKNWSFGISDLWVWILPFLRPHSQVQKLTESQLPFW